MKHVTFPIRSLSQWAILPLALGASAPALAIPADDNGTPAGAQGGNRPIVVEQTKERRVCYREAATGSMISKKTCRTVKEMQGHEDDAANALNSMRRRANTSGRMGQSF